MTFRLATIAAALLFSSGIAGAQQPTGSVALGDLVQGLGVNTRVLVIGAHPDDEDTYLISWLARGRKVETAYLSLTRGEGGQNLLGNELGPALGQIRTEELLAARRVDGGQQFFTRALDFGYSKTLAETSERWPRELILRDVVQVIREFRPHVIVSVWTGTPSDGHGHHQYSGVIAREAFIAAADSSRFSGVGGTGPWAAGKLYRVARVARGFSVTPDSGEITGNVRIDVGEYDPLLGRSYAEIAALSRSQHSSQAMGMVLTLGTLWDGLMLDTSRVGLTASTDKSIFDGIDTTWTRFRAVLPPTSHQPLESLASASRDAQQAFDALAPEKLIAPLGRVIRSARALEDPAEAAAADLALAIETVIDRASRALLLAAGVTLEALASREQVAVGDSVDVAVSVFNRGGARVELLDGQISVEHSLTDLLDDAAPAVTVPLRGEHRIVRRVGMPTITQSWWLARGIDTAHAVYRVDDLVTDTYVSSAQLRLRIDSVEVRAPDVPVVFRFADPARGELRHPLVGVPRISILMSDTVQYFRANQAMNRSVRVQVSSGASTTDTVTVELRLPPGLIADSTTRRVVLNPFASTALTFTVRGVLRPGAHLVRARATDRSGTYAQGYVTIQYPHIRPQRQYQPAATRLIAVGVASPLNLRVAYLRGVGDNVPPMLEQLGIAVRPVVPDDIAALDPASTSTLVIGPRALEVLDPPGPTAAAIQGFARRGGTVVMQYTQIANRAGILPYPVTLSSPADRVADETAPITILAPAHRLLRSPNVIGDADFASWVQERGLYMPRTFDPRWTTLIETIDPGERANRGALLVAAVGKGTFVYTTLSFFRQLPAGNPGAARLFVNLLSAGLTSPRVP